MGTGLTRLPEGLERFQKKGKSSEFNPRNYKQVKSSQSLTVWSHEGSNLYPKLPKNLILGQKNNFFQNRKKNARTKTKVFLDSNGHNFFRTVEKTKKKKTPFVQKKPKKKKKKKKKKS